MSLPQLIILAMAAMLAVATLRVVRVRAGRTPLPEGRGRRFLLLAFVVVPPIVLGALTRPADDTGQLGALRGLPIYILILATLVALMWIASLIVAQVMPGRSGKMLRFALVGNAGDPYAPNADPPVTPALAQGIAIVDKANAAFPRGPAFPLQIDRAGFREDWDALDTATRALEGQIADDHRLGLDVASAARATAGDARRRLDTLRGLALDKGQAWVGA